MWAFPIVHLWEHLKKETATHTHIMRHFEMLLKFLSCGIINILVILTIMIPKRSVQKPVEF